VLPTHSALPLPACPRVQARLAPPPSSSLLPLDAASEARLAALPLQQQERLLTHFA
jgi:hypothetical protein